MFAIWDGCDIGQWPQRVSRYSEAWKARFISTLMGMRDAPKMVAFRYATFCNPIICNYVNKKFDSDMILLPPSLFREDM